MRPAVAGIGICISLSTRADKRSITLRLRSRDPFLSNFGAVFSSDFVK